MKRGSSSIGETNLISYLQQLLPDNTTILTNYRHPDLVHNSGTRMELDVYCPELNLAFEYQGGQHYKGYYKGGARGLKQQQLRDEEKRAECQRKHITLITIPYWWDNTMQSLAQTIQKYRTDISLRTQQHLDISSNINMPIPEILPKFQRERQLVNDNPAGLFINILNYPEHMDPTN